MIVIRASPRIARLAAGGSSAERRVQVAFTAMQTSISFDAGTRLVILHMYTSYVVSCCRFVDTRRNICDAYDFAQVIGVTVSEYSVSVRRVYTFLFLFSRSCDVFLRYTLPPPRHRRSARCLWACNVTSLAYVRYRRTRCIQTNIREHTTYASTTILLGPEARSCFSCTTW